jgi:hypothetical protein
LKVLFVLLISLSTYGQTNEDAIQKCLNAWGKTPFKKDSPYQILATKVNVFGVGGDTVDNKKTKKPQLILIKPSVNVLGKATFNLLNPNGWYCLKSSVTVLGKTKVNIDCNAKMASGSDGVNVLGKRDKEQGVVVLGQMKVNQLNCK